MKKRGKTLRPPSARPGIVFIEGQQYRFLLDPVWKSELPPFRGMSVEVTFDADTRITSLSPTNHAPIAEPHGLLSAAKLVGHKLLRMMAIK
jgi:hypothetical protein